MKRIAYILMALMIAPAGWSPVAAEGAIAVGKPNNIAERGVAVGVSTDARTSRTARNDALTQCKSSNVQASTRALCRVVKTFRGQCAAVAMDPKPGTPGFGWAVAANLQSAKAAAIASCQATAGAGRARACRVAGSDCDG